MSTQISLSIIDSALIAAISNRCNAQPPLFEPVKENFDLEGLIELNEHFEVHYKASDPSFWKHRTVARMAISPCIRSLTFTPSKPSIPQMLYVQKDAKVCQSKNEFVRHICDLTTIHSYFLEDLETKKLRVTCLDLSGEAVELNWVKA